jgi:hypothetical protein
MEYFYIARNVKIITSKKIQRKQIVKSVNNADNDNNLMYNQLLIIVYILFMNQYDLSILKHLFFIKCIIFIAVSLGCLPMDALRNIFLNIKFCKYFLFPNVIQGDETNE